MLREHLLYAQFSKCDFYKEKIKYLGHVISAEGIVVDPENIRTNLSKKGWNMPCIKLMNVSSALVKPNSSTMNS